MLIHFINVLVKLAPLLASLIRQIQPAATSNRSGAEQDLAPQNANTCDKDGSITHAFQTKWDRFLRRYQNADISDGDDDSVRGDSVRISDGFKRDD